MKANEIKINYLPLFIASLLFSALVPQVGFSQAGTFYQCFFDIGCDLTEVEDPNNANSENIVINDPFFTIDLGYCSSQQDIIDAFQIWFDELVDPSTTCSGVQIAKVPNRPPPLDDSYGPLIQTTQLSPESYGNDRFLYDIGYNVNPNGSTPGQIYLPGPCGGAYKYEMTILGYCEGAGVPEQEVSVSLTIIVHRIPRPGAPESVSFSTCNTSAADILTAYDTWVDGFSNTLDPPIIFPFEPFFTGECSFPVAVYNATRNFGGFVNIPITNGDCNMGESAFDCFQRKLRSGLTEELIMNNDEIIIHAGGQYSGAPCPAKVGQATFTVSHTQVINQVQSEVELPACSPVQLIEFSWEQFMSRFNHNRSALEGCGATIIELFQKAKEPVPSSGDPYEAFDPTAFDPSTLACGGHITVWYQAYELNNRGNRATTIATFKVDSVGALQASSDQVCSGENLTIDLVTEGSLFFNPTEQFEILSIEAPNLLSGDANRQVGEVIFADGLHSDIWVNTSSSPAIVSYTIIPLLDCNPNSQSDPLCTGVSAEIAVTVEPLSCPGDIITDALPSECGARPTLPVSTDCGSIDFDITPPSGGLFVLGTTELKVYLAGFSEPICSFNVTVNDNIPPVFSICPNAYDVQCANDVEPCNSADATATDCSGVPIITCEQGNLVGVPCGGTITNTYTATDAFGNTSVCTQVVTIDDTVAPILTCPPENHLFLGDQCMADTVTGNTGVATATDNCGQVTIRYGDQVTSACGSDMIIYRTWTATDACGNSSVCDQIITISDTSSPVIICPADVTLFLDSDCLADDSPTKTGVAIASDNCSFGNDLVVQHEDEVIAGCGGSLVIGRTWTATDDCGNSTVCLQTITVLDTTPPSISCPPDNNLGCNPEVPEAISSDVIASDNCGEVIVVVEQGTVTQQSGLSTRTDTYTATDACGNQSTCTRTLQWKEDLERPLLSGLPANIGISCEGDLPSVPTVTAIDNSDSPVSVFFREVRGGTNCGGVFYERIWTATDACGNSTSDRQIIRLIDEEAPVIVVLSDTTINFGEPIPSPEAFITDNCSRIDEDFNEIRTDLNPGEYTLVRTWTATDGCFNRARASQTIQVVDTSAPVITVLNAMLDDIPNGGSIDLFSCESPAVAMSDIEVVDPNPELKVKTFDILLNTNYCKEFSYYRKWQCGYIATDGAGNVSEYSFYVYQYDTMAPAFVGVPPSVDLSCDSSADLHIVEVFAEDACSGLVPITLNENEILNPNDSSEFALLRYWTATDVCGNTAETNQTITFCGFDMSLAASSVGNTIWRDSNANGLQDSFELGIDSVHVNLYWIDSSQNARILYSTISKTKNGKSGQFSFDYLFPGNYQIEIVLPDHLAMTNMWRGDDSAVDSDINPFTLMSDLIQVDTAEILSQIDAGVIAKEELPKELLNLSGYSIQCTNTIIWTMNHENKVTRYELQRASNDSNFVTIATIDAQLDLARKLEYKCKDEQAQGLNQYRVKVLHEDGHVIFSEALDLELNCSRKIAMEIGVYPNPFAHVVNVGLDLDREGVISLKVVDNLGRVVKYVTRELPRGNHLEELSLDAEPPGIYWIEVRTEEKSIVRKVVKND